MCKCWLLHSHTCVVLYISFWLFTSVNDVRKHSLSEAERSVSKGPDDTDQVTLGLRRAARLGCWEGTGSLLPAAACCLLPGPVTHSKEGEHQEHPRSVFWPLTERSTVLSTRPGIFPFLPFPSASSPAKHLSNPFWGYCVHVTATHVLQHLHNYQGEPRSRREGEAWSPGLGVWQEWKRSKLLSQEVAGKVTPQAQAPTCPLCNDSRRVCWAFIGGEGLGHTCLFSGQHCEGTGRYQLHCWHCRVNSAGRARLHTPSCRAGGSSLPAPTEEASEAQAEGRGWALLSRH